MTPNTGEDVSAAGKSPAATLRIRRPQSRPEARRVVTAFRVTASDWLTSPPSFPDAVVRQSKYLARTKMDSILSESVATWQFDSNENTAVARGGTS